MRQKLGWKEKDPERGKLEVEAARERNQWTFTKRGHRTEDWETVEPRVADWENLLDVLERKYQRRRCAWRDVEQVQQELEKAKTMEWPT
jgi:hypothetical protein